MRSGKDIRDEQVEYRQSVEDRFIADGLANSDVQAAARAKAEADVLAQNQKDFDAQVRAIQETANQATDDN